MIGRCLGYLVEAPVTRTNICKTSACTLIDGVQIGDTRQHAIDNGRSLTASN